MLSRKYKVLCGRPYFRPPQWLSRWSCVGYVYTCDCQVKMTQQCFGYLMGKRSFASRNLSVSFAGTRGKLIISLLNLIILVFENLTFSPSTSLLPLPLPLQLLPHQPLKFMNSSLIIIFIIFIYIYIYVYLNEYICTHANITDWIHLGLPSCTCVQGWPLGIDWWNWFSLSQQAPTTLAIHVEVKPCGMLPVHTGVSTNVLFMLNLFSGHTVENSWVEFPCGL